MKIENEEVNIAIAQRLQKYGVKDSDDLYIKEVLGEWRKGRQILTVTFWVEHQKGEKEK